LLEAGRLKNSDQWKMMETWSSTGFFSASFAWKSKTPSGNKEHPLSFQGQSITPE